MCRDNDLNSRLPQLTPGSRCHTVEGLQLAFRRPSALKAVVTCCSTVDRYADDIHYMGGCLLTDNFNWSTQMLACQSRPPDPALRADWRERWIERIEALPFLLS